LRDILLAVAAITSHLERGALEDGLVFDAVRMRLVEIGEAAAALPADLLALEPAIEWRGIVAMRNRLAHVYFDTAFAIVRATVDHDLPPLVVACERLLERLDRL
jgi:uncharacterized protein with HEPN domain